jgi:hypothetical protein
VAPDSERVSGFTSPPAILRSSATSLGCTIATMETGFAAELSDNRERLAGKP